MVRHSWHDYSWFHLDAKHFLTLVHARRSIRRFQVRDVPAELVESLLEAARWAPSAHNRQPWRFVVIRSAAAKEALASAMGERLRADLERDAVPMDAIEADLRRSFERITGAPVIVLLCMTLSEMDSYRDPVRQQHERTMAVQSVAMAGENLLLAAHASGLGACWMCAPLFVPDTVRAVLGLQTDWEPQALITLGFPAETRTRTRKPLAELFLDGDTHDR